MRLGIDTNILVRSFVNDDTNQFRAVARLMREHQIVVSPSVLLEAEWVLRDAFKLAQDKVADAFEKLLGAANVTVLQGDAVVQALSAFRKGCDFADGFHVALSAGTEAFVTFDKRFARHAATIGLQPQVQLLEASASKPIRFSR
jgi:predicted nucleic-acid-binding protein